MHPGQPLPPDTLAAVYIQLPGATEFKLLGALGPEKQSAMYRINLGKGPSQASNSVEGIPEVREEVMLDDATERPAVEASLGVDASSALIIGISIEPTSQVQAQASTKAQNSLANTAQERPISKREESNLKGESVKQLARKIGQNAFDFLSSFTEAGTGGKEVVPIKAFEDWWGKFEKRIQLDPLFLMKDTDG